MPLNRETALVKVIEALDELQNSRLATAGLPHQGNPISSLHGKVETVEDLKVGAGRIPEICIPQLYVAINLHISFMISVLDFALYNVYITGNPHGPVLALRIGLR